jgi:hypothetical protein
VNACGIGRLNAITVPCELSQSTLRLLKAGTREEPEPGAGKIEHETIKRMFSVACLVGRMLVRPSP